MKTNTPNSTICHLKSIIQNLTESDGLAFSNVLSAQSIVEKLNNVNFITCLFSPDAAVFAFLSQVLGADQSCQATVAQVIAQRAKLGYETPFEVFSKPCDKRGVALRVWNF